MYIMPKELLILGDLSRPASRLVKGFMAKDESSNLEVVPEEAKDNANLLNAVRELYGVQKHAADQFLDSLQQVSTRNFVSTLA